MQEGQQKKRKDAKQDYRTRPKYDIQPKNQKKNSEIKNQNQQSPALITYMPNPWIWPPRTFPFFNGHSWCNYTRVVLFWGPSTSLALDLNVKYTTFPFTLITILLVTPPPARSITLAEKPRESGFYCTKNPSSLPHPGNVLVVGQPYLRASWWICPCCYWAPV